MIPGKLIRREKLKFPNFSNRSSTHLAALDAAFASMQDFEEISNHPDVVFAKHLVSGISILVFKKLETEAALEATLEFAEASTGIPKEAWALYSKALVSTYRLMEGK